MITDYYYERVGSWDGEEGFVDVIAYGTGASGQT